MKDDRTKTGRPRADAVERGRKARCERILARVEALEPGAVRRMAARQELQALGLGGWPDA